MRATRVLAGFMWLMGLMVLMPTASAQSSQTVSIGVGDTVLSVSGSTSPAAFVMIRDNASVIGTTLADSAGRFSQEYTAQTPGIHTISVFARDRQARLTGTVTNTIVLQEHTQTSLDIFLPPSLSLAKTEVQKPEQLFVIGETLPNSTVSVVLDDTATFKTRADAAGNWRVTIVSVTLATGRHSLYARASSPGGQQSAPTVRYNFHVLDPSPAATRQPLPVPTITHPRTGDRIRSETVVVQGTADPFMRVELWDQNRIIGSLFADSNGRWQLSIGLAQETYQLRARACRDDVCSRFSAVVKFTRSSPRAPDLQVELSRYSYTAVAGDFITLTLIVSGGQPPYSLDIAWGDGMSQRLEFDQTTVSLTHQYKEAGRYSGSVHITDVSGRTAEPVFSVQVSPQSRDFTWRGWLRENIRSLIALLAVVLAFIILIAARRRRDTTAHDNELDG